MVDFPAGLVRPSIARLAPYAGGTPIEEVQREYKLDRVIKLASNECPLPPSPKVRAAIEKAVETLPEYPDGNGFYLTQALARKHGVDPAMITLGSGSSEILSLLVQCFCQSERGDSLLFPRFSFIVYPLLAQIHGLMFCQAELDCWNTDLNALSHAIDSNTRIIFLASPANPLGTHCNNRELFSFIARVPEHILVVLDQAYADFVDDIDETISWLGRFPHLVITRTFSKAYGLAGLRVGYGMASAGISDLLNRIRPPFNTTSLAQAAALAALADTQSLKATINNNAAQMRRFNAWCDDKGIEYIDSRANFVTFRSPVDATTLYQQLLERGIILRLLANYAMPEYLRISMGTAEHMRCFFQAVDDLKLI